MKQKHFIDSHKGATPLAVLGLMAFYGSWENTTAWLYLATWAVRNSLGDQITKLS